jgi:hypothetical protein
VSKVWYHGSDKKFDLFRLNQSRRGSAIFITDDEDTARSYGKYVYTLELDPSTKLFDFRDSTALAKLDQWVQHFLLEQEQVLPRLRAGFYPFSWDQVLAGIKQGAYQHMGHPIIAKALKALKYEGWYEIETGLEQVGITNVKRLKILGVQDTSLAAKVARRWMSLPA